MSLLGGTSAIRKKSRKSTGQQTSWHSEREVSTFHRPSRRSRQVESLNPRIIMSSPENKDLLAKMFSSFVARKTRMSSPPVPRATIPARLPPVLYPTPTSPRGEKRSRPTKPASTGSRGSGKSSRVSASTSRRGIDHREGTHVPEGTRVAASSVRPGARSHTSIEAIATDSTSVPKPFHCEKCSSAFRQRSQLSRHFMRVHERQKPFACSHCDKSFASAFDRKRHVEVGFERMLTKMLLTPYFVVVHGIVLTTLCCFVSSGSSLFFIGQAVHGRRCIEFFCDRCPFRTKAEVELTAHIRAAHERDQCRLCGKVFKRPANLLAHERHYHSRVE